MHTDEVTTSSRNDGNTVLPAGTGKKGKLYYIQNGYVGNAILWWGIDSKGYTTNFAEAGKYTYAEAKEIIKRPQDRAWLCSYVDKNEKAKKLIIDGQYLDRNKNGVCLMGSRR
jgi:hypothetical protein